MVSELVKITEMKDRVGPCGDIAESIKRNEKYLREHFGPAAKSEEKYGTMTEEEIKETAAINALTNVVGCIIQWEIDLARRVSYGVLEEVNDHGCAALVEKTFKKCR